MMGLNWVMEHQASKRRVMSGPEAGSKLRGVGDDLNLLPDPKTQVCPD